VGLFFRPLAPGVIKGTVNKILKFSPFYLSIFLSFYILSLYQEKQKEQKKEARRDIALPRAGLYNLINGFQEGKKWTSAEQWSF